jgi:hypothetical protein
MSFVGQDFGELSRVAWRRRIPPVARLNVFFLQLSYAVEQRGFKSWMSPQSGSDDTSSDSERS